MLGDKWGSPAKNTIIVHSVSGLTVTSSLACWAAFTDISISFMIWVEWLVGSPLNEPLGCIETRGDACASLGAAHGRLENPERQDDNSILIARRSTPLRMLNPYFNCSLLPSALYVNNLGNVSAKKSSMMGGCYYPRPAHTRREQRSEAWPNIEDAAELEKRRDASIFPIFPGLCSSLTRFLNSFACLTYLFLC